MPTPGLAQATQLPFAGFPELRPPVRRRRTPAHREAVARQRAEDNLLPQYLRRLRASGAAEKTINAYTYQLHTLLAHARVPANCSMTLLSLFRDPLRLGQALNHDRGDNGQQFSRWTLAQRRSAVRSFATLMYGELRGVLGEDPHGVLDQALRAVAQRVGTGYQLPGGRPRQRGGYAPDTHEVTAILTAVARAPDFAGARNAAFFTILADSGARINALRELNGIDCVLLPNGRMRLFLHAKAKKEPREIELSSATAEALQRYVEAFNHHARVRGWRARVRLGEPGPVWRNVRGACWSYKAVGQTLRNACATMHLAPMTPHALRRAFATNAASHLPRDIIARAGGWDGVERLDNHYVQPRAGEIRAKLGQLVGADLNGVSREGMDDAATGTRVSDRIAGIRAGPT